MNKLKECRKAKKMTQEEVAKLLNVTTQTYQNYELNKREPNIETLIKLANIFDTTIDYLIGREKKQLINKNDKEILEYLNKLKENEKWHILEIIKSMNIEK